MVSDIYLNLHCFISIQALTVQNFHGTSMTVNLTNPEYVKSTHASSKQKVSSKKKSTKSSKKSSASSKKKTSSKKSGSKLLTEEETGLNRILKNDDQMKFNISDLQADEINDVHAEEKDLFEKSLNNFDEKELFSNDATNKLFLDKLGRQSVLNSLEDF